MFLLVEMVEMVPINRQEIIVEVAVAVVVVLVQLALEILAVEQQQVV